ncbi:trypsin-like peptidase domain-containing protein [Chloroflexota bacterium]
MALKIPSFNQLIETYVMCCVTEGKSRKTTEWYTSNLKRFNEYLNKHKLAVAATEIGTAEARHFIFYLQNNAKRWENCLNIHVRVHVRQRTNGSGRSQQRDEANGSGLIITPDGYLVTNRHVVENAAAINVSLADGSSFQSDIIGQDKATDLEGINRITTSLPPIWATLVSCRWGKLPSPLVILMDFRALLRLE